MARLDCPHYYSFSYLTNGQSFCKIMSRCQGRSMNSTLENHFKEHSVIGIPEAESLGVSRAVFSLLVKKGELQRLSRGLYMPAAEIPDELVAISRRSPLIIFSHETALVLHKLHNRIPGKPAITLPTGKRVPHSIENEVSVFHVRERFHKIGLSQVADFQGHLIPCYDAERTVCDIIRSYSRIDEETYVNAIRNYAKWPNRDLTRLFGYARQMGMEGKAHKALEVVL